MQNLDGDLKQVSVPEIRAVLQRPGLACPAPLQARRLGLMAPLTSASVIAALMQRLCRH